MKSLAVIGIAGGTASGKTTLADYLTDNLPLAATLLPLDRYYHDLSHLSMQEREEVNFDHPGSLDLALFADHLNRLKAGETVDAPVYDFTTHTRTGFERIEPHIIVLTEGILLPALPEIRSLLTFSLFLNAPRDIRLERKIHRDVTERGRTEAFARKQFDETTEPMFEEWVLPHIHTADFIIDGAPELDDLFAIAHNRVVTHVIQNRNRYKLNL